MGRVNGEGLMAEGIFVGGMYGRILHCPLVRPPTYVGVGTTVGDEGTGDGDCGFDNVWGRGGHVERPGASSDGCGSGLWNGIWGRVRADRRDESGATPAVPGDTVGGTGGLRLGLEFGEGWSGRSRSRAL